jgi:proteasome lid subunit RPN8/RPN11
VLDQIPPDARRHVQGGPVGSGGDETASVLVVPAHVWRDLIEHLSAAAPLEGVGLLGGRDDEPAVRADAFYPGTNVDASPTRYTMEPAEVLAAFRAMEANGGRLVAIVHSHPATPPVPSATDLTEAYYPDAFLVIVGLAGAEPWARCWRLLPDPTGAGWNVVESKIVVE